MAHIKLKSLLKENEMKAKSMWNRLDADSREDILLRFVKNPADAEKMAMKTWDTLPDNIAGNKDFQDAITDQKGLRETANTSYGKEEAIKMIWDDPGNKIESSLQKIRGYESTVQGEPRGKVLNVYFSNEQSAKKGAKVLSQLVPGPQYDENIKSEDYGGVSTEWYIEIKA